MTVRKILRDQMASPNTTSEATGASLLHQVLHATGYAHISAFTIAVWKQTLWYTTTFPTCLQVSIGLKYAFNSCQYVVYASKTSVGALACEFNNFPVHVSSPKRVT